MQFAQGLRQRQQLLIANRQWRIGGECLDHCEQPSLRARNSGRLDLDRLTSLRLVVDYKIELR